MQYPTHQSQTLDSRFHPHSSKTASAGMKIANLEQGELELVRHAEAAAVFGGIASPNGTTHEASVAIPSSPAKASKPIAKLPHWSTALQNLLDQPPSRLPLHLVIAGMGFFCVVGAWAWLGQVQDVSRAQGRIVPQGEVYKVQPVTQGEITRIKVKEGQHVKAGQVLMELDSRLAEVEVDRLKQTLTDYRLQLIQTQSLIDKTRLEAQTRQAIASAEIQAQQAVIAQAEANTGTQQELLTQLQAEIDAYQVRLERLKPLAIEGAIAQDHLFDVEAGLREQHRTIIQTQGNLQQSLAKAKQIRAELIQKQAESRRGELEAQQRLQQLAIEANQLNAKIAETENLLRAAVTQMTSTRLQAPVDGIVSSLIVRNTGEVAQPTQTVAEIAPDHAPLILSAVLPTQEAGLVQKGMPVQIKLDAFPYQDYGIVSGKVLSISPDAIVDQQLGSVYEVEVTIDRHEMTQKQKAIRLRAGQTATAEIVTRERRIIDVILDPIRQLQTGGINF